MTPSADTASQSHIARNYSVEVLRIVAMLCIVAHHFSAHGAFGFAGISANRFIVESMGLLGKTGVAVFVLITGYYAVRSAFSFKKPIRLSLQVIFYSVVLYLLTVAVGAEPFIKKEFIHACLPLISNKTYWFAVTYIELYCLMPLLNAGISHLTRRQHCGIILFLFTIWTVIPFTVGYFIDVSSFDLSNLGMFVLLYLIGAYLRLYPVALYRRPHLTGGLLLCCFALMIAAGIGSAFLGEQTTYPLRFWKQICVSLNNYNMNSLLSMAISVLALIRFQAMHLRENRFGYAVAGATFGVYLIHDHYWLRSYLWSGFLRTDRMRDLSPLAFFGCALGTVIAVFAVCTAAELARKYLLENGICRLFGKRTDKTAPPS